MATRKPAPPKRTPKATMPPAPRPLAPQLLEPGVVELVNSRGHVIRISGVRNIEDITGGKG